MKTILVVDDEDSIRESLRMLLGNKGYRVVTAENGREGIGEIERSTPDLILTDISMPDMEGIEFLKTVRSKNKDLPVIVMSGHATGTKFFKAAALLGATATLKKPFSAAALYEAIAGLVR